MSTEPILSSVPSQDDVGDQPVEVEPVKTVRAPVEGARAELARKLVDVLALPSGQVNDNERAFTGDILSEVFDHIPHALQIEISQRLSTVLAPPPGLLSRLILDEFDIASPLLEAIPELPEALLGEAARKSPAHRQAIVKRKGLTDVVADTLLEAHEWEIDARILKLQSINLSEQRVDQLVERSKHDERLRDLLLRRLELQPRHGFAMFWWIGAKHRKQVLSRFAIDRTVIQNALKPLFEEFFATKDTDFMVKRVLVLTDRRHRPRNKNGEAVSIEVVEKMLTAARANPSPDLCAAAGVLAGVRPDTATKAMFDENGEPFAILCKSIGISRAAFAEVMRKAELTRKPDAVGPHFDEEAQDYLLGIFDMIARDFSRTVLRYWDWQSVPPAA
ncbi:MAG: DUF2336 domain-containing protein [Pseudomonadota bacterium]